MTTTTTVTRNQPLPSYLQFLFGGLSGICATLIIQPFDLLKTRLQLSGEGGRPADHRGFSSAVVTIVRREGFFGLYQGLSAALLRQVTYTTTRLGVFGVVKEQLSTHSGGSPAFHLKVIAGLTAGACGALVGTPADVVLVRMTADGRLPIEQRRGYKHVFDALIRVVREEGVITLWRGCVPTVGRAMALNAAQLASYDQAKEVIIDTELLKDGIAAHISASTISGLIASLVSLPFDVAKTRLQNMETSKGPPYKGMLDCIWKTTRYEGLFSLWKGFIPYFLRLGPQTIFTFIFLEQFKAAYFNYMQMPPKNYRI
ncbi:Mitochondrial 2-oxoglutarate/malate carrier protein [Galdieria sulphuraria]|uniref:Mitochondrial 2-oxoglutarate/malate carrier protein n=1 Tax=Galdieria sulphuraria TaxID=130081 RepID=M2XTM7_GALSU|nr:mitochondrial carrier, oxoglutarate:malate antiporter [Galdieria sulphuraria]EME26764.1 mitochondrial carrier, oxoglutarate:malate antiporter [Galdieria sulphuraria]GJD07037.1 Mitochondrial 2-oxoglutarate/malate carrier protein [Galdieria sulphuraria]|eukprot:XP_005703284.1 mitochondrial carrier, oxoglutarate:malate antiporter [Galdieria sulphuraria]